MANSDKLALSQILDAKYIQSYEEIKHKFEEHSPAMQLHGFSAEACYRLSTPWS